MIEGQAGSVFAWRLTKRVMILRVFPRLRSALLIGACVLSLASCAGIVQPEIQRLPERVELNGVPFFRSELY